MRLAAKILTAISLLACSESALIGPSDTRLTPIDAPRRQYSSLTANIPVAPFSDWTTIDTARTGIVIPKLSRILLSVNGLVTASPVANAPCGQTGGVTEFFGEGANTDYMRPWVTLRTGPKAYYRVWGPSETTWKTDTIGVGGEAEVYVSRGGYGVQVGCYAPDGTPQGGPLLALSSSQTLTVEVITGTYKLGVTPQLANPVPKDTTITFIESNDGDTQDDFKKDSWLWTPADGGPPVELWLNGCGFTCRFKVTKSGTMKLSGSVGGFLDGHRERVSATSTVTVAGDAKINLAVSADTVEENDTVLVTTTITGATKDSIVNYSIGGILASRTPDSPRIQPTRSAKSSKASGRRISPEGGALLDVGVGSGQPCVGAVIPAKQCFVVAGEPGAMTIQVNAIADGKPLSASKTVTVLESPKLAVACTTAQRGADVLCTARVTSSDPLGGLPFVVIHRSAKGKRFKVDESPNAAVSAGQPHVWKGPAVAKTEVEFTVSFEDRGKTKTDSKKTTFDPTSRGWQEFKLLRPGQLRKKLIADMTDDLHNGVFGMFDFEDPSILPDLATKAPDGPNTGLSYFIKPVPFTDFSESYVHPGLYGGINGIGVAWYNDQNGKGSGSCKAPAIATLQSKAEVHEGVTADPASHWQKANDAFEAAKLQQEFDAMYVQDSPGKLVDLADKFYFAWKAGDYTARQKKFDSIDRPIIFGSLNCSIDYKLSDN